MLFKPSCYTTVYSSLHLILHHFFQVFLRALVSATHQFTVFTVFIFIVYFHVHYFPIVLMVSLPHKQMHRSACTHTTHQNIGTKHIHTTSSTSVRSIPYNKCTNQVHTKHVTPQFKTL